MCKVLEEMEAEAMERAAKRKTIEIVKRMLSGGLLPLETIAQYVGLSLEEVKKLQSGQSI